ncbi:hypothetical protein ACHAXS_003953 [Conticribra weissflogii]
MQAHTRLVEAHHSPIIIHSLGR